MKLTIKVFLVTILVGCASCTVDTIPTFEKCKVEDEECLVKTWSKMTIVAYTEGIPELGLPISDRNYVDKQEIVIGSNLLTLKILFKNVTVFGMANTTYSKIKGFKKDPNQMSGFELFGRMPYVGIRGKYTGSGKLLLLEVTGSGDGEIDFYNINYKITVSTKVEVKDGEEYLVPSKVTCSYEPERMHFKFENILNNKEISDGINNMINDNQVLFGREVNKPAAMAFSRVFKEILIPIFAKFRYRRFFLE